MKIKILDKLLAIPSVRQLLLVNFFHRLVGITRLHYFVRVKKQLKTMDSKSAFGVTLEHNLKGIQSFDIHRMDLLIKPISVLEFLDKDSRILVIGPRNEGDILKLIGHGFKRQYIRGLDLISYSPMIDIGDMHKTSYQDNSFDIILIGWTLAYSKEPKIVAQEMLRIADNGCVIGIGHEFTNMTYDDEVKLSGYAIVEKDWKRINSTKEILKLFGDNIDEIYFNHDAPSKRSHTAEGLIGNPSSICLIFTVKK